jgi:hypothetical protein
MQIFMIHLFNKIYVVKMVKGFLQINLKQRTIQGYFANQPVGKPQN